MPGATIRCHRRHPGSSRARAVAIAYATAMQESKLADLHYGDLDSVGVFQQRPSEGWGTASQLEDPVYATGRFFDTKLDVAAMAGRLNQKTKPAKG